MSSAEAARVCIGCTLEAGGDNGVALVGLLISVASAAVSFWAVTRSSRNHDALILREEFQPHRLEVEANLRVLDEKLEALELSVAPSLLWSRIEANFTQEQADTLLAALNVIAQARKIDEREIFSERWADTLRPIYRGLERSWSEVDRAGHLEGLRRAAANDVVARIREFRHATRRLIENGVKAPLARKRWRS